MHMMRSWDAKTDTTLCRKMYIHIQVFRSLFTSSSRQVCHFLLCIENYMIFLKILTHSADRSSTLVYLVKFDPDLNIIIRPFDTPSDFPISKEKWCLGHMDEISDVRLLLSRLNLTSNWFKVWPKFEFEFSLPLLWLVNSKIFRN